MLWKSISEIANLFTAVSKLGESEILKSIVDAELKISNNTDLCQFYYRRLAEVKHTYNKLIFDSMKFVEDKFLNGEYEKISDNVHWMNLDD